MADDNMEQLGEIAAQLLHTPDPGRFLNTVREQQMRRLHGLMLERKDSSQLTLDMVKRQLLDFIDHMHIRAPAPAASGDDAVFYEFSGEDASGRGRFEGRIGGEWQEGHDSRTIGDMRLPARRRHYLSPLGVLEELQVTPTPELRAQVEAMLMGLVDQAHQDPQATVRWQGRDHYLNTAVLHARRPAGTGTSPLGFYADPHIVGYIGEQLDILPMLPSAKQHFVSPTTLNREHLHRHATPANIDEVEDALLTLKERGGMVEIDGHRHRVKDMIGYYRSGSMSALYADPALAPFVAREIDQAPTLPEDKQHFVPVRTLNRLMRRPGYEAENEQVEQFLQQLILRLAADPGVRVPLGGEEVPLAGMVLRAARETGETGRGVVSYYADPALAPFVAQELGILPILPENSPMLPPYKLNEALDRGAGEGHIPQVERALAAMLAEGAPIPTAQGPKEAGEVIGYYRNRSNSTIYAHPLVLPALAERLGVVPYFPEELQGTYLPFYQMRERLPGAKVKVYQEEFAALVKDLKENQPDLVVAKKGDAVLTAGEAIRPYRDAKGHTVLYLHRDLQPFFERNFIAPYPEGEDFIGSAVKVCRHPEIGLRDTKDRTAAVKSLLEELWQRRDERVALPGGEEVEIGQVVRRLSQGRNIGINIHESMVGRLLTREMVEGRSAEIRASQQHSY